MCILTYFTSKEQTHAFFCFFYRETGITPLMEYLLDAAPHWQIQTIIILFTLNYVKYYKCMWCIFIKEEIVVLYLVFFHMLIDFFQGMIHNYLR